MTVAREGTTVTKPHSTRGSGEKGQGAAAGDWDARSAEAPVPQGFTLGLALVDTLPVIFFCLAAIVAGLRLQSPLFVAGSLVAFASGVLKVSWKLVIALARRNIPWLTRQMRYLMPLGFALMLVGLATSGVAPRKAWADATSLPAAALLLVWLACMGAMGWFATHNDQADARSNWIEQATNALGQACLLAALLLMP